MRLESFNQIEIDGIDSPDWKALARQRARAMFRSNQGMAYRACLLANVDKTAIDKIQAAPVLALAATSTLLIDYPKIREHNQNAIQCAKKFAYVLETKKGNLADILANYCISFPMRRLPPYVVCWSRWHAIKALSKEIDPRELGQLLVQPYVGPWLRAISWLLDNVANRSVDGHVYWWGIVPFAARQLRDLNYMKGVAVHHEMLRELADFYVANHKTFGVHWTLKRALKESTIWHETIRKAAETDMELDFQRKYGVTFDWKVEGELIPSTISLFDDYEAVRLRSGRDLWQEGTAMRHCVLSYAREVLGCYALIYSLRKNGERIATIDLSATEESWLRIRQVKGRFNAPVSDEIKAIVANFVDRLTEQISVNSARMCLSPIQPSESRWIQGEDITACLDSVVIEREC